MTPYVQNGPTRKLLLYEGLDHMGRLMPLLGTTTDGGLLWMDPVTENPVLGSTELWEVYNTTPDAHPVHLHGVALQVVDRQRYAATQDTVTGALSNIRTSGPRISPGQGERGWKDTAPSYPGEVLRLMAKFDLPGKYVWHCHILSHEDNEMMRPILVGDGKSMKAVADRSNGSHPEHLSLDQNIPNPFSDYTKIDFRVSEPGAVSLKVYDLTGKLIDTLIDDVRDSGAYSTLVKTSAWETGMYLYVLTSNGETVSRRMVHH
jgi:spore coat protein A